MNFLVGSTTLRLTRLFNIHTCYMLHICWTGPFNIWGTKLHKIWSIWGSIMINKLPLKYLLCRYQCSLPVFAPGYPGSNPGGLAFFLLYAWDVRCRLMPREENWGAFWMGSDQWWHYEPVLNEFGEFHILSDSSVSCHFSNKGKIFNVHVVISQSIPTICYLYIQYIVSIGTYVIKCLNN